MKKQLEVKDKNRADIVEWMVSAQQKHLLENETLFLSINIMDRYLEKESIPVFRAPLIGVVSMLIASKYEEIYPPSLNDFLNLCSSPFTHSEVRRTELVILNSLKYDISIPTVFQFLQRFRKLTNSLSNEFNLALYICEIQMLISGMAKYPPSLIAVGGIYLAKKAIKKVCDINHMLLEGIEHTKEEIEICAKEELKNMMDKNSVLLSNIRRKYSKEKNVVSIVFDSSLFN